MPHATPPQGRLLGDFRIVREIGRGGMGVVYEAVDDRRGRRVALKVLEAHLTLQRSAVDRFLREAHAAAALRHPHVVPVEHVGEEDGVHFFAMELIEGASLADVIAQLAARARDPAAEPPDDLRALLAPFVGNPFVAAAGTIAAIARALHHAHRNGVLHRDVKPSNILLRRDGTPLLIDFGLAREEGLPALTQTGDLVGSPYYVAPEQCGGGHATLDPRVDVYALGVVLYELVTLRRPFEGSHAHDVLAKIETGGAPPPRELRPDLPRDLDAVVRRAMARQPEDRYPTAAELARDLERFLAGRPIRARSGAWRRGATALLRARGRLAGAAAAGLLLVGALAVAHRLAPRDLEAAALAPARLTLETEQLGAIAEIFDGEFAHGPARRVTLPQHEPLRLAPGRHALRLRAAGHDARVLEGARSIALAPGEERVVTLWLAPIAPRFALDLAPLAAAPVAADLDGDGRDEIVVVRRGGALLAIGEEGIARPFAQPGSEPYLLAAAPGGAGGTARVVSAAADGISGFACGFDAEGSAVLRCTVRGRVKALLAERDRWLAGTDLGEIVDLTAPTASDGAGRLVADLPAPVVALALVGDRDGRIAALTRTALVLVDPDGGAIAVAEGGRPVSPDAALFVLGGGAGEPAALAVADGDEVRLFAPGADGAFRRSGSLPIGVRHGVVVPDRRGDRLALTTASGRLHLVGRDGREPAEIPVGESAALATARAAGGERSVIVAAGRALVAFTAAGRPRFELSADARIVELIPADVDGDGAAEIALRLEGDRLVLLASEPEVRWKAGLDVDSFLVATAAAPGAPRVVAHERGGMLVTLAADGRRLSQARLSGAATAFARAPDGAAAWLGGADGVVRAVDWSGPALAVAPAGHSDAPAITALALGRAGEDGSLRIVTGDAGGAITCRLPDGSREARFTPRTGASVRHVVVGDLAGDEREEVVAALSGGLLLRFDPGMQPRAPVDLGRECAALALVELDGAGGLELLVALEGGELRVVGEDGATRASFVLPATATAIRRLGEPGAAAGAALVGAEDGGLYRIELRDGQARRLALAGGALLDVAAGDLDGDGETELVALTATRVCVFAADGRRRLAAAARGGSRSLALVDLDGDGAAELLHVDERGRLVARELPLRGAGR